ncbi:MAG: sulfotransferase [Sphingomonadaceae bacterium]|nr:sulfotransferase [Sphingomonadaceae bacterium]
MTATATVPIRSDALLANATRETGLDDFGDFDISGPLAALCDALDREARLNARGEMFARERLATVLATRLRVVEDRKRIPAIADQSIERPIIIPSMPRTGTTLLFNLLAQDPDNRVPLCWETLFSSPPPEAARYDDDPRIDHAEAMLDRWGLSRPDVYAIHPLGARLADECVFLCEQWLVNTPYGAFWNVPSYVQATAGIDRIAVFGEHRKLLQHLQVRKPGKRWLLKAPSHLSQLDALTAVYPDAVFVQTHRDLRRVLPSYASLFSALRRTFSDDPANWNADAMLRETIPALRHRLARAAAFRATAPQTFIDILYVEMASDPLAAVRGIYRQLDLEFAPAVEARMVAWLAENRKGKHGTPDYSLAAAGITDADVEAAFGDYMTGYGIPREGRS